MLRDRASSPSKAAYASHTAVLMLVILFTFIVVRRPVHKRVNFRGLTRQVDQHMFHGFWWKGGESSCSPNFSPQTNDWGGGGTSHPQCLCTASCCLLLLLLPHHQTLPHPGLNVPPTRQSNAIQKLGPSGDHFNLASYSLRELNKPIDSVLPFPGGRVARPGGGDCSNPYQCEF